MNACLASFTPDEATVLGLAVWLGIALVAFWAWQVREFQAKPMLIVTNLAMLAWLGAVIMENGVQGAQCKIFWAQAAWPGITLVPTAWSLFLMDYAFGPSQARRRWRAHMLLLGPLVISALAASNGWHEMFYGPGTGMVLIDGREAVRYDHGPLFYGAAAYLYIFMLLALGVVLSGLWQAQRLYRGHFAMLLAITAVPILANLSYLLFGFTFYGNDPTSLAFSVATILLGWMILVSRPFEVTTVAKDTLYFKSPNPVVIFDLYGNVLGCNPAARARLGVTAGTGGDIRRWPQIGSLVDTALAEGGTMPPDALQLGQHSYKPALLPIEQPLGQPRPVIGWLLELTDVTDLQSIRSALESERDFLATLMETDISGIAVFDTRGQLLFANSEARMMLGTGPDEHPYIDTRQWRMETLDGQPMHSHDLPVARVLASGKPVRDVRFFLQPPGGTRRALSVNAAPVSHEARGKRVVCSVVDISEQIAAEQGLRENAQKAEAASAAKSAFLANMSHEIRTPMNGVLGMAALLDESLTDAEQKRMVSVIRESGELLLGIINDILDLSKIEAGRVELELAPFRPADIARKIEAVYRLKAEEKSLAFALDLAEGAETPRLGDAHRVMQILHNLISNAVKFTETGEVRVTLGGGRDAPLRIEISDTGIGMTTDEAARLFEPFVQADSSTTRRFGGTGLGMSIVRQLVETMQGEIHVDSQKGTGTRIYVSLPLEVTDIEENLLSSGHKATAQDIRGLHVLVADDNRTNQLVLSAMLRKMHVTCDLVDDGAAAVAACDTTAYDALLLDISMPVMDGASALKEIRARATAAGRPAPPAIAVTANALRHQVEAYLASGFQSHLPKPFSREELEQVLQGAVEKR